MRYELQLHPDQPIPLLPRRYRFQYLDGWKEKDTRAAMLFGRAFEKALAAFFQREDASEVLFNEWAQYRDLDLAVLRQ